MTTEHTHDGPEFDADAVQDDEVTGGTTDAESDLYGAQEADDDAEHPFDETDYDALIAELADEAEMYGSSTAPDEADPGPLDGLDPKTAAHVRKLREEAADNRAALQATTAELEALGEWVVDRMHRDVEQLAAGHKMIQPAEVWHVAELSDFLDPDTGDIDETRVASVIAEKVPAHWRVQPRTDSYRRTSEPQSGASGFSDVRSSSWGRALKPNER